MSYLDSTGGLRVACLCAAVAMASPMMYAEGTIFGDYNPFGSETSGVRLYSASVTSSYFQGGYGIGLRAITPATATGAVGTAQGGIVLGWSKQGKQGYGSVVYSPSYVRGINLSGYESWNQSVAISAGRSLGTKWDLAFSANGMISDFSQLLFARSQYGSIVATPATFEEFVAAVMTGSTTNVALAQTAGAAALLSSPETAFLYGDRLLTSSASVSAAYAYSTRSIFRVGVSGSRVQQFRKGSNLPDAAATSYVVPNTSAGTLDVGWSYSLTPRTTMGVNVSSARTLSRFQDAYSSQANVSLGHTMSRHWFVQGMVGVGVITPVRQTFSVSRQAQSQYGGSLGYKLYSHTFLGSFMHAVSDVYGIGANTSDTSSGAWAWRRPGSSVSLGVTASYSNLNGVVLKNARSWMGNASIGKALGSHFGLSAAYSYTQFPTSVFLELPNLTQKGVVVSLSWSPGGRR
jgi:hypothetical protein